MKKNIAKQIRDWADSLPLVYEWEDDTITMSGWELNRTPYGENNRFNDDEYYCVPTFKMRAVMHEQQMKDAYKRDGFGGVIGYIKSVSNKID